MARRFGKIDEWELWVPESEREIFEDNPDEALTMELRFISREELLRYGRELDRIKKKKGTVSGEELSRRILENNVRNIRNYVMNGEPITDGADLMDKEGEPELIREVVEALTMRGHLEEGLAKNLNGLSDTPSAQQ